MTPHIPPALDLASRTVPDAGQLVRRGGAYITYTIPTDKAALPPLPSVWPISENAFTIASAFLVTTLLLQIIATLLVCARIYIRAFPAWRFTIDDWLISIAFLLMSVMFALMYASMVWAWGGHNPLFRTTDELQHASMIGTLSLPFWAWSTGITKISIACMLLRFSQGKRWRVLLYTMIALNVVFIIFMGVFTFFQCIPYEGTWDIKGDIKTKKCWNVPMNLSTQYVTAACNVSTDVVFSLMPLTFLGKIRRPLREKVVIGGLMALGLIASGFSLAKAIITAHPSVVHHLDSFVGLIGLFSCLEVQTSMIAACIPTLRSASKKVLQRIGLISETVMTNTGYPPDEDRSAPSTIGSPSKRRPTATHMEFRHIDAESAEGHDLTREAISSDEGRPLEEAETEELFKQDPVTGRIICVTNPSAQSHSSEEDQAERSERSRREDSGFGELASWGRITTAR